MIGIGVILMADYSTSLLVVGMEKVPSRLMSAARFYKLTIDCLGLAAFAAQLSFIVFAHRLSCFVLSDLHGELNHLESLLSVDSK